MNSSSSKYALSGIYIYIYIYWFDVRDDVLLKLLEILTQINPKISLNMYLLASPGWLWQKKCYWLCFWPSRFLITGWLASPTFPRVCTWTGKQARHDCVSFHSTAWDSYTVANRFMLEPLLRCRDSWEELSGNSTPLFFHVRMSTNARKSQVDLTGK